VIYAFVADPHVGNMKQHGGQVEVGCNARAREVIRVLADCKDVAARHGADHFVVLGDLFDSSNPNPQMVHQTARALQGSVPVEIIVGNHDQVSVAGGDHALAPFSLGKNLQVIEEPTRLGDLLLVPFQPGPAKDWLRESIIDSEGGILCIHLGVEDGDTPHFLQGARDSIHVDQLTDLAKEFGFCAVFAGNWHNMRKWDMFLTDEERSVQIIQCGTICPKTFSDDGFDLRGKIWFYDTAKSKAWCVDMPGPRFVRTDLDGLLDNVETFEAKAQEGFTIYVRVTVDGDELEEARQLRDEAPAGIIIEIDLDPTEAKAAVTSAASVARSAETFEEALDKFIDQYPIEEPGTKDGVVGRIRRFRRESA